jgi:predicted transcriptional regulator
MANKQVLVRMSPETHARLEELSTQYGMTKSALVVSLIQQQWRFEEASLQFRVRMAQAEAKRQAELESMQADLDNRW